MSDKKEYSRLLVKRSTESGIIPTIFTGTTLDQMTNTDIFIGEIMLNSVDDRCFIRSSTGILEFQMTPFSGGTVDVELEIGDWNMDTTSATTVSHGLSATEWKTVRNISLMVRNDLDTEYYTVDASAPTTGGGFVNVLLDKLDSTNFNLYRLDFGSFDSGNFSATTYNRGWINFTYKPD